MSQMEQLQELASKYLLDTELLDPQTDFEEKGIDSYSIVDFMLHVEETYNIVVNDDDILSLHNLQDVLNLIDRCKKEEGFKC